MPQKPDPHEDLLHFARRHKVSRRDLQSHPDNAGIFSARDATALHEEDEIEVPESPEPVTVESGKTHVLVYAPPERTLKATLHDHDGHPLTADFTVKDIDYGDEAKGDEPTEIHGYAYKGTVEVLLPGHACKATLVADAEPAIELVFELGRVDPLSTRTGFLARLHALGLYDGPFDEFSVSAMASVQRFQLEHGLPVTGHADASTRARLAAYFGDKA